MTALDAVQTKKVSRAFSVPEGKVLGYGLEELAVIARRCVGYDGYKGFASTEDYFTSILDCIDFNTSETFLRGLIAIAVYDLEHAEINITVADLERCKELMEEIYQPAKPSNMAMEPVTKQTNGKNGWSDLPRFATYNRTSADLLVNPLVWFKVPKYQRKYCWTLDHCEDLWKDLVKMSDSRRRHFMGFVVLRENGKPRYEVLDGQQRFTTMLLIVSAAHARLKQLAAAGDEPERVESMCRALRRVLLPDHEEELLGQTKLELNKADQYQFKFMVDDAKAHRTLGPNKALPDAFEYFLERFQSFTGAKAVNDFVLDMFAGTWFTEINVPHQMLAYTLFESLNNRGMGMAGADMLKNLVISVVDRDGNGIDFGISENWDNIVAGVGQENFFEFLRAVRMRHGKVHGSRGIYGMVDEELQDRHAALAFVKDLSMHIPCYNGLKGRDPDFFSTESVLRAEAKASVETLAKFDANCHLGVSLAAYNNLAPGEFVEFMKFMVNMEIRHNVACQWPRRKIERLYAKIAGSMENEGAGLAEVRRMLNEACPDDNEFKAGFRRLRLPAEGSSQQAIYFLTLLEKQANSEPMMVSKHEGLTVEHVLPQNPDEWWREHFVLENPERYAYYLGNLALLPAKENSLLGQADVDTKFKVLAESGLKLNEMIAEGTEWNYDRIMRRQGYMAKLATSVWPMP